MLLRGLSFAEAMCVGKRVLGASRPRLRYERLHKWLSSKFSTEKTLHEAGNDDDSERNGLDGTTRRNGEDGSSGAGAGECAAGCGGGATGRTKQQVMRTDNDGL